LGLERVLQLERVPVSCGATVRVDTATAVIPVVERRFDAEPPAAGVRPKLFRLARRVEPKAVDDIQDGLRAEIGLRALVDESLGSERRTVLGQLEFGPGREVARGQYSRRLPELPSKIRDELQVQLVEHVGAQNERCNRENQ